MAGILGLLGLGGGSQAPNGIKQGDEPTDWFAQFNPANKSQNGGINPNPGQAQSGLTYEQMLAVSQDPNKIGFNDPKGPGPTQGIPIPNKWEPYVPHGGFTGYGEGGMTPPPADIQPNQPSYADFQRDYWAPDREQVLAGMTPPMATSAGTGMIDGQRDYLQGSQNQAIPDWTRNQNSGPMPQMDWPMPQKQGGSIWSKLGSLGLGGLASGGKPQGGLVAQALIKMRTPHGTVAHVPPNQIEEALRRGATQIGGQ